MSEKANTITQVRLDPDVAKRLKEKHETYPCRVSMNALANMYIELGLNHEEAKTTATKTK